MKARAGSPRAIEHGDRGVVGVEDGAGEDRRCEVLVHRCEQVGGGRDPIAQSLPGQGDAVPVDR